MDMRQPIPATDRYVELLRRWVLGIILLGLIGTVTELIFLKHYEEPLQLVPLILIVAAVVVIVWYLRGQSTASLRWLQTVMGLFVLSGFAGMAAHFNGAREYQLEIDPDLSVYDLLVKIIHTQAPPLLAPGMMLQLGLLGLAYAYTEPRYRRSKSP